MNKKKGKYWKLESSNEKTLHNYSHKHDFPIDEIWNTDNALAQLIVPRLQAFKTLDKHGYPSDFTDMRTWNKKKKKMINAFELMKYVHFLSIDEERIVSEGLALFCKYFSNLWD